MHSTNTATGAMDPLRNSRCRRCFCSRFAAGFQPVRTCRRGCGAGNASSGNRGNETCRHGEKPRGYRSRIQHFSCRNTLGNHIRFRPGRPSRPRSWWAADRGTMIVCLRWLKPLPASGKFYINTNKNKSGARSKKSHRQSKGLIKI